VIGHIHKYKYQVSNWMKFPPKELDALFTPRSFTAGVKAQEAQSGYYLPPELLAEMIGGGSGLRSVVLADSL
jgi:hypothetical protein